MGQAIVAGLLSFFTFLTRLKTALGASSQLHTARFARFDELSVLKGQARGESGPGLLLGTGPLGEVLSVRATPARRELGNVLVVAPTRGGKGLLASSQLLSWKESAIVNDIKGELFEQTAGYRATLGPVFVLDPRGVGHRFDPLLGKTTEDELFSSATQLLYKAGEGEGAIFTQRAIVMLTQLFLAARLERVPPLPYVRQIIRLGLPGAAERLWHLSPDLSTQFLDTDFAEANLADRFLLSAWGTLSARLRPLLTETVVRCLSGADFTPESLIRGSRPVTLYLRWPERDLLALSPLVRLLWGTFIDETVAAYDACAGRACRPVLLLIDEAGRTAIPSLADHATTVVGRGISLWVAVQSLAQLDAVYGRERAQVLRDNMETQLYYRPADLQTAEHLERALGRRSGFAHSQTLHEGAATSEAASEQAVPLLTAQEIRQLADTDVIGFHRALPPFQARRMDWRRFPVLTRRRDIPPPELPALPALAAALPARSWQGSGEAGAVYIDPDLAVQ
jgi:type IV secretion system protein VirD4